MVNGTIQINNPYIYIYIEGIFKVGRLCVLILSKGHLLVHTWQIILKENKCLTDLCPMIHGTTRGK